jgi:hypothetical protein
MIRRLATALAACLLGALALAPASGAVIVGIADQKPAMLSDARFERLGIQDARLAVAWDALSSAWQVAELDEWLGLAYARGVAPLVSFGHSRLSGERRTLPTPERYRHEFRRFRARYPWVHNYATWNEANHCGEPTCHRPKLVAAYYRVLRQECPRCRILAAEVLDQPSMPQWVRRFNAHSRYKPRYWGLHNYIGANRLSRASTSRFLRVTSGNVWLTEVGGLVGRRNRSSVGFEQSTRHAARVTSWIFERLLPLSRRITRVYIYQWNATRKRDTWDSALIGPDGRARPAYYVLRRILDRHAAAGRTRPRHRS